MTNWFIVNISGMEVPEGFFELYFGTMKDRVHYFKERNSRKIAFERLLHDRVAAELLKENRPNYNLLFIVSIPINVLENISKEERGITPFISYIHQEVNELSEFIGSSPFNTVVFEIDEHFDALSIFKKSSIEALNTIHDLDHLKKDTPDYKIGKSWSKELLALVKNNQQQSNIEYLLNNKPLFYFRIPIKDKNRMELLHHLFSFFQLIICENIDLNDTTIRKGRYQELSFIGNEIRKDIPGLVEQISDTLNGFNASLGEKELSTMSHKLIQNQENIDQHLYEISAVIDSWKSTQKKLSCQSVKLKNKDWKNSFNQLLVDIDNETDVFLSFLNKKPELVKITEQKEIGTKQKFQNLENNFKNLRNNKNQEVENFVFNKDELIQNLKTEVEYHFEQIDKDIDRCPNFIFLSITFAISLLFYFVACYTFFVDFSNQFIFIGTTLLYLFISAFLFLSFKNKSIKKIKANLKKIQKTINQKGDELTNILKSKTSNQIRIHELNTINKNLQNIELVFKEFEYLEQKNLILQNKVSDINTIGFRNGKTQNYRFKEQIKHTPNSLADFLEIYSKTKAKMVLEVEKDKSPQEPIDLLELKINAIKKIMIST